MWQYPQKNSKVNQMWTKYEHMYHRNPLENPKVNQLSTMMFSNANKYVLNIYQPIPENPQKKLNVNQKSTENPKCEPNIHDKHNYPWMFGSLLGMSVDFTKLFVHIWKHPRKNPKVNQKWTNYDPNMNRYDTNIHGKPQMWTKYPQ